MALGAVAAGNIKAQLAARVVGIIKSRGLTFKLFAMDAKIGRIISVDAILEVSSVKKLIPPANAVIVPSKGRLAKEVNWFPKY